LKEHAARPPPELAKIPSRGTENAAVLPPQQQGRAMKQQPMKERPDCASTSTERAADQADGKGLIIQMRGLITQDAPADCVEQTGTSRVTESPIKRHCENFSGNQHDHTDFQARQLSKPAKDIINPIVCEPRNLLAVEELPQQATVTLLFGDEQLE